MPTPNELRILRTAMERGAVTKRQVSRKMGITTEYAGYLLESLSKRDLLSAASPGKFELTSRGADAILFHLHHLKGIITARAYGSIRQLDKVNEKIGDYEEYLKKESNKGIYNG